MSVKLSMSSCRVFSPRRLRWAAAGLALAGLSACALPGVSQWRGGNCEAEPSACAYEPGEEAYAEREAARLNRASAAKLRRSSGR